MFSRVLRRFDGLRNFELVDSTSVIKNDFKSLEESGLPEQANTAVIESFCESCIDRNRQDALQVKGNIGKVSGNI